MKNFASVAIFLAINWIGLGALDRIEAGATGSVDRFLIGAAVFIASIAVPILLTTAWDRRHSP